MTASIHAEDLLPLDAIRAKLDRAERDGAPLGNIWRTLRRETQAAPDAHAWYTPFVAAVTGDEALRQDAKRIIARFLEYAELGPLGSGVQFHFWCFAFPFARWAIWFDLLRRLGAYGEREAEETAATFLRLQLRDYHSGLLTKPHPECVDNQAASLCLSSVVLGTLFADGPGDGTLAMELREEALGRAEAMIGGMPASGYSGEGSTYQGVVVAITIPFFVEFLERAVGGDWFDRPCAPNGTSAHDILRMTVRLWQPSGLLLPWDDYGYQFGCKAPIAFLARRTGEGAYLRILEDAANWNDNPSAGWGFDDPVWALVHWPEARADAVRDWQPWAAEHLGGVLVNPDGTRYLMQMWDETIPKPTRPHVNPNALVLEADGIPLTADGAKSDECHAFDFDDTWVERRGQNFGITRFSYGKSTGAGHGVLLVDGWETLRPAAGFAAQTLHDFDADGQTLTGDVTGLYASVYPDCRRVLRRSRLVADRAWLVEDLARFDEAHEVTSRWYFRPGLQAADGGVDLETPEGMGLSMRALAGPGEATVTRIDGYPRVPDNASDRADYRQQGRTVRWLWLFWPDNRRVPVEGDAAWRAWAGPADAGPDALRNAPADAVRPLAPSGKPWRHAGVPIEPSWWFEAELAVPADGSWWMRLPRGLPAGAQLWLDGEPVDLAACHPRAQLLPVDVPAPGACAGRERVRAVLHLPFQIGHYPADGVHHDCPDGPVRILAPAAAGHRLARAVYADGEVRIETESGETLTVPHALLPEDA